MSKKAETKTTKPGTEDTVAKAPKEPKRKIHPIITDETTSLTVETMPGDFDFEKHLPIKRKAFAADWEFFNYKALEMEHRANEYRTKAEESKKLGAGSERAKAKRLVKLQEKINELQEQLAEQGVDVDALLASVG